MQPAPCAVLLQKGPCPPLGSANRIRPGMTSLSAAPRFRGDAAIGIDEALRMVEGQETALFLDVDGTLLDLAATPTAVSVSSALLESLDRAARKLHGALALVSGRTIDDVDRLFAPLRLSASGVHGAEIRIKQDEPIQISPAASQLPASLRTELRLALGRFSGVLIEDKGFSVAIHYRLNRSIGPALGDAVREWIASKPRQGLDVQVAHDAFEVKRPSFDKGKAIALFMDCAPFRGRVPLFIGDDKTDEAGFATVTSRGGGAYSVGRLRSGAIGFFEAPQSVRDWLAAFASYGESE